MRGNARKSSTIAICALPVLFHHTQEHIDAGIPASMNEHTADTCSVFTEKVVVAAACPWNQGEDSNRQCSGGETATVICDACDSLRTTWLTRLLSEEHVGFTRRQLLGILNRHKSYSACRQIIRIMHQHRVIDDHISDGEAASIMARSPRTPSLTFTRRRLRAHTPIMQACIVRMQS